MFSGYTALTRRSYLIRIDPKRMWRYEAIAKLSQGLGMEYQQARGEDRVREIATTQYEPFKAVGDGFLKPKLREIILKQE